MFMIRKKMLLVSCLSILALTACGVDNNQETSSNSNESIAQSEDQEQTESAIQDYQNVVKNFTTVTAREVTDKINNGDAFYLFIGKDTCPYCREFAPKLEEASTIFESANSEDVSVEPKIYYLDLSNIDDLSEEDNQFTMEFTNKYDIDSVPAFQYFEGQIYHSEIEDIDSNKITVDEIKEFINTPYDDEDVTTAPDTNPED